jgi:hypothetical protein
MSTPTMTSEIGTAITGAAGDATTIVLAAVAVAFGVYALKPAWRVGRAVLNKIGF